LSPPRWTTPSRSLKRIGPSRPTRSFYNEQKGKLSETFLVPLDFDRGHTLTGSLTISESANWLISVLGYFRTGTPYTPAFPSSVVPITFEQNSDSR